MPHDDPAATISCCAGRAGVACSRLNQVPPRPFKRPGGVAPKGETFGATGTLPQFSARASLASANSPRRRTTRGRTA